MNPSILMITSTSALYWEDAKADTITDAKRYATREFGVGGFADDVLAVGIRYDSGEIVKIATKSNRPGSRWVDCGGV